MIPDYKEKVLQQAGIITALLREIVELLKKILAEMSGGVLVDEPELPEPPKPVMGKDYWKMVVRDLGVKSTGKPRMAILHKVIGENGSGTPMMGHISPREVGSEMFLPETVLSVYPEVITADAGLKFMPLFLWSEWLDDVEPSLYLLKSDLKKDEGRFTYE